MLVVCRRSGLHIPTHNHPSRTSRTLRNRFSAENGFSIRCTPPRATWSTIRSCTYPPHEQDARAGRNSPTAIESPCRASRHHDVGEQHVNLPTCSCTTPVHHPVGRDEDGVAPGPQIRRLTRARSASSTRGSSRQWKRSTQCGRFLAGGSLGTSRNREISRTVVPTVARSRCPRAPA